MYSTKGAVAAPPLLATKLYSPRWRAGLVSRPRLIERIQRGVRRKLTLISAPPGFGKTTLLAEWLAHRGDGDTAAGWVSLEASDNDATLFWAYFISALQRLDPEVGKDALSALYAPDPPPIESVLTPLINDIHAADSDFVLILDDYHVIDAPRVHSALSFFLEHLPPRMHLVIASRSDPPLPLSRLRARGELTELRAVDLRFTPEQAAAFLSQVMALDLSVAEMAKLERRTEGWIAGLKLAALSMEGRKDVRAFIDAFSGDNRYVTDYLVDEVLQAQPERIRHFLLATAILDRMNGALCDAVTGEQGSQALLETLERRNLFLVSLDDKREWFRYHHLFADVLQAHSAREEPERLRTFHRRASAWYEHHGSRGDAIRHAFAAEDLERAAGLLEAAPPPMDKSYQAAWWLERVKALPDTLVRSRPLLDMSYAWGLLNAGELESAEARIGDLERWLDARTDKGEPTPALSEMVIGDEERFRSLPADLVRARVYLAQSQGASSGTVAEARRSLGLIPEGDSHARTVGIALLALALWASGDLEAAHRTFADALAMMRRIGNVLDAIRGTFVLGDLRVAQGRLQDAARAYRQGLDLAAEQPDPGIAETDELYLGLSELHREWGDLDAAERLLVPLTEGPELTEQRGNTQRLCIVRARILEARGDLDGALELLDQAEGIQVRDPLPRLRPVAAMKARVRTLQGRLDEAMAWVRAKGLSAADELSFAREFEHITLARVLIAQHGTEGARSIRDAVELLERITTSAGAGGRAGSVIESQVLLAVAHQTLSDARAALAALERALRLAEPEGYLRVFVDEGVRMRDLLRQAAARGIGGEYVRRLLAAFDAPVRPAAAPGASADAPSRAATEALVQPLTARELEILRLIAAGLRNQEIARQLFISPATVKRHIANAYMKLGVGHRTEALVRARDLNLL